MTSVNFFNVAPALPDPDTLRGESQDSLRSAETIAQSIEAEIRNIALDRAILDDQDITVKLCVDFDVIYSVLHLKDANRNDSFWRQVVLDLEAFDIVLLPGTLFELINYINRRPRSGRRFDTNVSNAFLRAFEEGSRRIGIDAAAEYDTILSQVLAKVKGDSDDYLLSLLKDRLKPLPAEHLVTPNYDLFYRCIWYLSEGSRSDKIVNNRVDAYNMSLVAALNEATPQTKVHYAIVSNATSMKDIYTHVCQNDRSRPRMDGARGRHALNMVWEPRYASLHQLVHLAADNGRQRSSLAWSIVERLVSYRATLSKLLGTGLATPKINNTQEDSLDGLFIQLISSIEALQTQINRARRRAAERLALLKEYEPSTDPFTTRRLIRGEIKRFLSAAEGRYGAAVAEMDGNKEITVKAVPQLAKASPDDKLKRYALVDAATDNWVAGAYSGADFSGLYFETDATLDHFVAIVNYIRHPVLALVGVGELPAGKDRTGLWLRVQQGNDGRDLSKVMEFEMSELKWPLTSLNLCQLCSRSANDIVFARLNTHWFDVSFELLPGGKQRFVGMVSHLPLYEQFASFISELNLPRYRVAKIKNILLEIFERGPAPVMPLQVGLRR